MHRVPRSGFHFLAIALLTLACNGGAPDGDDTNDDSDDTVDTVDTDSEQPGSFEVSTEAGEGGSLSPESATVLHGDTTAFTVEVDEGFGLGEVTGCGGTLDGTTFTTGAVTQDCTVTASFEVLDYELGGTVVGLSGGTLTLSLNGDQSVVVSGNESFAFAERLDHGSAYAVSVAVQPTSPAQVCGVAGGTGEIVADVDDILVVCVHADLLTLAASPANQRVTLTWNAEHAELGAAEFHVCHASESFDDFASCVDLVSGVEHADVVSPYIVTGLVNGQEHHFQVEAVLPEGQRIYSPVVDATPEMRPARIVMEPASVALSLPSGATDATALVIHNEGYESLNWTIETENVPRTIWDQPESGTSGIISDYFRERPEGEFGVFTAVPFVVGAGEAITEVFIPGFFSQDLTIASALDLNWMIYEEVDGAPAGVPFESVGAAPVWSFAADPDATGIALDVGRVTLDVEAATGDAIVLPAGRYWLTFFPEIIWSNVGTRWNWFQAANSADPAKVVDPSAFFGATFASWTPIPNAVSFPSVAFTLEGALVCELPGWLAVDSAAGTVSGSDHQELALELDTAGLAPGVYSAVVCIGSDDLETPFLAVPVTLEVTAE